MTNAVAAISGVLAQSYVGAISAYTIASSPIADGSPWYRTGKIIQAEWASLLSDEPISNSALTTHFLLTGDGTLWKNVVFPGDVFQHGNPAKQFEITKVISDTKIKIRVDLSEVNAVSEYSNLQYSIIPLGQRSESTASSQIASLLQVMQKRDLEITEWLTGVKNGGLYQDGRYPITTISGTQRYIPCPSALIPDLDSYIPGYNHSKSNGVMIAKDIFPVFNQVANKWTLELPFYSSEERMLYVRFPAEVISCDIVIKSQYEVPAQLLAPFVNESYSAQAFNRAMLRVIMMTSSPVGTKLLWPKRDVNPSSNKAYVCWNYGNVPNFVPNQSTNEFMNAQLSIDSISVELEDFNCGSGASSLGTNLILGNYLGKYFP